MNPMISKANKVKIQLRMDDIRKSTNLCSFGSHGSSQLHGNMERSETLVKPQHFKFV